MNRVVPNLFLLLAIAALGLSLVSNGWRPAASSRIPVDVPVGTVLPYFGASNTPPQGFKFLDKDFAFPNAPWVPTDLKDAKIDFGNSSLGFASDLSQVGKLSPGSISDVPVSVPAQTLTPTTASLIKFTWHPHADRPNPCALSIGPVLTTVGQNDVYHGYKKEDHPQSWPGYIPGETSVVTGVASAGSTVKVSSDSETKIAAPRIQCRWIIRTQ